MSRLYPTLLSLFLGASWASAQDADHAMPTMKLTITGTASPPPARRIPPPTCWKPPRFSSPHSAMRRSKSDLRPAHEHREGWYYVPGKFIEPRGGRLGLCIKDMTPQQRLLAHGLLASVTSSDGYRTATGIMTLEQILHEKENKNPIRDPEDYYVSIFGKPEAGGTWGWRFEGHHLSINAAIAKGKLFSLTPSFFATNPGTVEGGAFDGVELLAPEQDLARSIAKSLTPEQGALAILPGKAPADILTKQKPRVEREDFLPARGIPFEKLDDAQKTLMLKLIAAYAGKYRPEILTEIDSRKPSMAT